MNQLFQYNVHLSLEDFIGQLNLSNRSVNALSRSGIRTVGEVVCLVESGGIRSIRGLGRKCILEIEDRLTQVEIIKDSKTEIIARVSTGIGQLKLSIRSFNALQNAGIKTLVEVISLVESGRIGTIRGLGRKCILEIEDRLTQVEIIKDLEAETIARTSTGIGQLKLSIRSFNALQNAGIKTLVEVISLVESGRIGTIRGLGRKCILEIESKLAKIEIDDMRKVDVKPRTTPRQTNSNVIPEHVIRWQSQLVAKQLSFELLHEHAKVADCSVIDWLGKIETLENDKAHEVLSAILGSSINICEELELLLNQISGQHCFTILLSMYGFDRKKQVQIGREIGISRERVRQLNNELKDKVLSIVETNSVKNLIVNPAFLRMQTALLLARDMGLDINYQQWTQRIRSSGLVGNWITQEFADTDAVEVMIAICNLLTDCNVHCLHMHENLQYAVHLAISGTPDIPAKILHARETLPDNVKRLINRHTKHSGGVDAKWLSQEIGTEIDEVKDILLTIGYRILSQNWFIHKSLQDADRISMHDVFHHGLRKMFQYCGQVSIDNVCSGLRHVLSRTNFPVPPPDVMDKILRTNEYRCKDGLYFWDGIFNENLNAGETVIMDCVGQTGPVVHHTELVHAFIESNLSFSTLHATLHNSPLFEKIEPAIYKVRGKPISYQDIKRAKDAGERQSPHPEVEYDTNGNIIVSVTLRPISVGLCTIFCEQLPDLSGNWPCYISGEVVEELYATQNEFRRLRKPFELMKCQSGERLKFIFNTWKRTVAIEKVEGYAKQDIL